MNNMDQFTTLNDDTKKERLREAIWGVVRNRRDTTRVGMVEEITEAVYDLITPLDWWVAHWYHDRPMEIHWTVGPKNSQARSEITVHVDADDGVTGAVIHLQKRGKPSEAEMLAHFREQVGLELHRREAVITDD